MFGLHERHQTPQNLEFLLPLVLLQGQHAYALLDARSSFAWYEGEDRAE